MKITSGSAPDTNASKDTLQLSDEEITLTIALLSIVRLGQGGLSTTAYGLLQKLHAHVGDKVYDAACDVPITATIYDFTGLPAYKLTTGQYVELDLT